MCLLVELFGQWVKPDHTGRWVASNAEHKDAFVETLGVAFLTAKQMRLLQPAAQTVLATRHPPPVPYVICHTNSIAESILCQLQGSVTYVKLPLSC